ncbi:AAA family ATPase [Halobacillus sp. Marseille-Q1614]|uniref:AAA family ATPase n=1 Tax=Halobacillus sp. Marseille-Q1614 TaxID=2709134 RepID=UPI00156F20BA|nr:AAA family ATPase [Halobacillus sp. Marseille-Q1614]
MSIQSSKSIYIISGPCGVGKSTITKALAQEMEEAALLEGDVIYSMLTVELSWERHLEIVWQNILSLTRNFVENNLNVVIDYVVESELEWFCKQLTELNVHIYYVVLRADEEVLMKRLNKRGDLQLGKRSLQLLEELEGKKSNQSFLYDTTDKHPSEIAEDLRNRFKQFRING